MDNPRQVRDFAKALGRLAETDPIDSEVLMRFAEAVKPQSGQILSVRHKCFPMLPIMQTSP